MFELIGALVGAFFVAWGFYQLGWKGGKEPVYDLMGRGIPFVGPEQPLKIENVSHVFDPQWRTRLISIQGIRDRWRWK